MKPVLHHRSEFLATLSEVRMAEISVPDLGE
jgi:hypothetical protein